MIWFRAEIRLDVYPPQHLWADRHADDQKYRNIGNLYLLSQQASDDADGQNEPTGEQRVFRNFNRGRCFQFCFSALCQYAIRAHFRHVGALRDAARPVVKWQGRRPRHSSPARAADVSLEAPPRVVADRAVAGFATCKRKPSRWGCGSTTSGTCLGLPHRLLRHSGSAPMHRPAARQLKAWKRCEAR